VDRNQLVQDMGQCQSFVNMAKKILGSMKAEQLNNFQLSTDPTT
jgi:hypothetical protein